VFAGVFLAMLATLPFAPQLHEGDAVPPIALVDQDGRAFDFESLLGRAVVVSFVYTRCTDRCALVAAKLARLARGVDARDIAVLALTVDPDYNRPRALRRYRGKFESPSPWTLATGQRDALLLLERRLGVEPESNVPGRTDHEDLVVLLDAKGRIARFVPGDDWTPGQMAVLARAARGGPYVPLVALEIFLREAAASCGRTVATIGIGSALLLVAALALAIGVPLVRSLGRYRAG